MRKHLRAMRVEAAGLRSHGFIHRPSRCHGRAQPRAQRMPVRMATLARDAVAPCFPIEPDIHGGGYKRLIVKGG